jgi:hypothetical protein
VELTANQIGYIAELEEERGRVVVDGGDSSDADTAAR